MPADRRVLGPLDTDTAPEAVANGRSAYLRNVQLERGYATTVRGNVAVGNALSVLPGISRVVGACLDPDTQGVVWLQWNDAGLHRVAQWKPGMGSPVVLLTWGGLRLPAQRGLTHAAVLDGLLVFLDAAGELRSVNLARAAAGAYTPAVLAADPFVLHLVRQPPQVAPTATRQTNSDPADPRSRVNRVAGAAWQFAFQYEYQDGERTPLGPFSPVLPAVSVVVEPSQAAPPADGRNFIRVPYPASALAPTAAVRHLRLLVRAGSATVWRVAGNFGAAGQPFDFYGGGTGEVVDEADGTKLFEAVPVAVGAMAIAQSRVMVGDCTEGYAPSWPLAALGAVVESVSAAAPVGVSTTVYQTDTYITYDFDPDGGTYSDGRRVRYFQLISGSYPDAGSRYRELLPVTGGYTSPVPANTYAYRTIFTDFNAPETNNDPATARVVTVLTATVYETNADGQDGLTLHERVSYPVGVAFYDGFNRTAGAEAVRPVFVPRREDYGSMTPMAGRQIRWSLDAATPVPAWARSYQLLLAPNTDTSHFLQFLNVGSTKQFEGNNTDGTPRLSDLGTTPSTPALALWVSVSALLLSGRGYEFAAGDRLRFLLDDGPTSDFPILYQRGEYVAIPMPDVLGGLPQTSYVELYTPAPALDTQVLYERGPRYPVANPGTPAAALTTLTGTLSGDCRLAGGEAMLPDGSRYTGWLTPARGRPIPVNPEGVSVRRKSLVRFSGEKAQGTRLNGLSTWDALNQKELPLEAGAIVALHLAAQGQAEGRTLIALQERGTETLYLGQVPLSASIRAQQTALLVQTDSVIGGTNALGGGYGTRHPGSVVAVGGRLFWWCADQGEFCRYAADGVNPLNSQHQCQALGRELADAYAEAEIVGGYDPRTKEYVLCFGAVGELPARTVRFSEQRDGFVGDADYTPEAVVGSSDTFYSVQDDGLWHHTDTAPRLSWYGQPAATARARVWANAAPGLEKTWLAVVEEGGAPLWEVTAASTPAGQTTLAPAARMVRQNSKWEGPLLLDANSPGFTGTDARRRALYEGDPVQSTVLLATLDCADTTATARLVALNLEFIINSGQTAP